MVRHSVLLKIILISLWCLASFIILFANYSEVSIVLFFIILFIIIANYKKYHLSILWNLSFFIYIYSLPHVILVLFLKGNSLFDLFGGADIYNDKNLTIILVSFLNQLLLTLLLFATKIDVKRLKTIQLDYYSIATNRYISILFLIFLLLAFIVSYSVIDIVSISDHYAITEDFSLLFGVYYFLFFKVLIDRFFSKKSYFHQASFYLFIVITIFLILLGVRQLIFWACIGFYFANYILRINSQKASGGRVNKLKNIFFLSAIYIVFVLVLEYRFSKSFRFDLSFESFLYPFNAETSFTFISNYHAFDVFLSKNSENFAAFKDIVFYLIPSQLWSDKYNFIALENIQKKHGVTPFGTYHILSSLLVSSKSVFIYMVNTFFLSFFLFLFEKLILSLKNAKLFLVISIVFLGFYPVRGTFAGGLKILIYLILFATFYQLILMKRTRKLNNLL